MAVTPSRDMPPLPVDADGLRQECMEKPGPLHRLQAGMTIRCVCTVLRQRRLSLA